MGSVPLRVKLSKIESTRIDNNNDPEIVTFDVDVKMDELTRTNDELTISFLLMITTKPSLVNYEVGGVAIVTGGRNAFESALTIDEKSGVPRILHTIYQKVFTSVYLVASVMDAPYPPPDLIYTPSQTRDVIDHMPNQSSEQMVEPIA
jgi:hypothetical protein